MELRICACFSEMVEPFWRSLGRSGQVGRVWRRIGTRSIRVPTGSVNVPTYQYQCTECGEALEVVQKFTDDSLTVCPACEGKLRKVYSAVGIVFKGSGFYRTDSRNGSSSDG